MIGSEELKKLEFVMESFERPWFVAGGWTIDLAVNEVTREHKDIDICIFREDAEYTINYFSDWDIQVAIPGEHRLEKVNQLLDIELPRYCLHLFQGKKFLEILLTEQSGKEVIFRKNRDLRMNINDFSKQNGNLSFVNPAWQLLFKSLSTREEDEHDFKIYINKVNDHESKKWLFKSIKAVNGNQEWTEVLRKDLEEGGDIL